MCYVRIATCVLFAVGAQKKTSIYLKTALPYTMTKAPDIIEEIVDFIVAQSPQNVMHFHPSDLASDRYAMLIAKEKTDGLSDDEKVELNKYELLELMMRRVKIKASQFIEQQELAAK